MTDTRWRDSTPAPVKADLDTLLDAVLQHTRIRLDDKGAFLPFTAGLDLAGEVIFPPSKGARAPKGDPQQALASALTHARTDRDTLRAVALVSDVRMTKARDAVRVELEHREGTAIVVMQPYSPSHKPGGRPAAYHQPRAIPGEPAVWTDAEPAAEDPDPIA